MLKQAISEIISGASAKSQDNDVCMFTTRKLCAKWCKFSRGALLKYEGFWLCYNMLSVKYTRVLLLKVKITTHVCLKAMGCCAKSGRLQPMLIHVISEKASTLK